MSLHSRNNVWDVASMLHMAHVSELCLALSGGLEQGGLPTASVSVFQVQRFNHTCRFWTCGNLTPPMTSVRKGLENAIYRKWERWRHIGTDGVGWALSMSEDWLRSVRPSTLVLSPVWTWYPIQRPLSPFIIHTHPHMHTHPSEHVNLFSHDSRTPFQKNKGKSVKGCHEAPILSRLCIPFWTEALVPVAGS